MRTIFNFLGPLTNPAGANRQLLGVADRHYQETIAEALVGLGSVRALVVSAEDGLDELSLSARTRVIEVADGRTAEWFVEPGQFGLAPAELEAVAGGTPEENAAVVRARCWPASPGPRRDLVLLNAAAAIYVGGLAADLEEGVAKAAEAIDSGAAANVLERLIAATAARRRLGSSSSSGNDRAADRRGPGGGGGASRASFPRPISRRGSPAAARIAPSTRRWRARASR